MTHQRNYSKWFVALAALVALVGCLITVNCFANNTAEKQDYTYVVGKSNVNQVDASAEIYTASGMEDKTPPKLLTLRDAILLALRYNPNVQNAEIDRVLQKFALRIAYNQFELQYALTGSTSYSQSKSQGIRQPSSTVGLVTPSTTLNTTYGGNASLTMANNFPGKRRYNPQVTLAVTQPLLRGAGRDVTLNALRGALDTETLNKLTMKSEIISTITTIISQYYAVVQANNNIITSQQSVVDAKRTITTNAAQIKVGQLQPTGNIEAESQLESLNLSLAQAINSRDLAEQTLLESLGLSPNMKIRIPNDATVENLKAPDLNETINYALAHNITYITALINYKQDKRELIVAKNAQLWQLDLAANASVGTAGGTGPDSDFPSLINSRNNSQTVSLSLSVPINDLARQQQLISARIALEKDKINLAAAKRALETSITSEVISIRSQIQQLAIATKTVDLAQQSYQLEGVKARLGRSSPINVTTAQNALIQAKISLIDSKIAYIEAVAQLDSDLTTTLDKWKVKIRY